MKNIILASICSVSLLACSKNTEENSDGYTIYGKVLSGSKGNKVKLEEIINEQLVVRDSAVIGEDSAYILKGKVPEPGFYRITIGDQKPIYIALENKEKINITLDDRKGANDIKITGSKQNAYMQQLNAFDAEFQMQGVMIQKQYQAAMSKKDKAAEKEAMERYQNLSKSFIVKLQNFIDTAKTSIVLLSAAEMYLRPETDMEYLTKLENRFKKELPNSQYTKKFSKNLSLARQLSEGQLAPDFELATPEGGKLKLSSLRGKVVLVDFWASWCKPCIASLPELKATYNEFKNQNFEVFGVSLDANKEEWTGAIKKHQLPWKHASDLKEWQSVVTGLYRIEGIPYTVLLDKEGKIAGKNLRGEELKAKIKTLL